MDSTPGLLEISSRTQLEERLQAFSAFDHGELGDHNLNPDMLPGETFKQAAVLIPVVDRKDGLTVLFTQRTDHLTHHPGQISFPGGHRDAGDETLEETALRETEEEVGIERQHIEILGRISQYKTRTGFDVTPVVGFIQPEFEVKIDTFEVAEVFEVPLAFLLDPSNHKRHKREFQGAEREFFAMPYNGYYIWGATAGMLVNFYKVLSRS